MMSSLTPGRVVNSCSASSKRTWVTAAPGIDESNVRRNETPRVWPNPGSSGPMAKRWRLSSSSPSGFDGRALDDKHCGGPPGGALLGKELDDQRLADGHIDVLAHREIADRDLEAIRTGF